MDTLLQDGDHLRDRRGFPAGAQRRQELVQEAVIRMTVPRGAFAPDPELGSRLRELRGIPGQGLEEEALACVREALAGLSGVRAQRVNCQVREPGRLELEVWLWVEGEELEVAVEVAG